VASVLLCDYPNPDGQARLQALRRLGHDVVFFNHQASTLGGPVARPARTLARSLGPLSRPLRALGGRWVTSRRLLLECERTRPDIVLVVKGTELRAGVLRAIKRRVNPLLVNWFGDSLLTPGIRAFVERDSAVYDFFFVIDDERALARVAVRAAHVATLPFACDPEFHRPVSLTAEERAVFGSPVAFVGTVIPSRENVLAAVAEFGLKIWGPPRSPWAIWATDGSPLTPHWQGRAAYGLDAVKVYNASDIVLDIHFAFGQALPICNVTARVFEVPACGGFLLTNAAEPLERLYAIGREMVTYRSVDELRRLIAHYLAHPDERRRLALAAHERARSEHTFEERLREMFGHLERKA